MIIWGRVKEKSLLFAGGLALEQGLPPGWEREEQNLMNLENDYGMLHSG